MVFPIDFLDFNFHSRCLCCSCFGRRRSQLGDAHIADRRALFVVCRYCHAGHYQLFDVRQGLPEKRMPVVLLFLPAKSRDRVDRHFRVCLGRFDQRIGHGGLLDADLVPFGVVTILTGDGSNRFGKLTVSGTQWGTRNIVRGGERIYSEIAN